MGQSVQIKFCGITSPKEAEWAVEAGCDAIGINFYPNSPRFVSLKKAGNIVSAVPLFTPVIAVVVNPSKTFLQGISKKIPRIAAFQIHGAIPKGIQNQQIPWLATLNISPLESNDSIQKSLIQFNQMKFPPIGVVGDSKVAGLHGGSGITAPWDKLTGFNFPQPFLLAGGLNPENVAEAIKKVRPSGVDVASGIETAVGKKNLQKMREFVLKARQASKVLAH